MQADGGRIRVAETFHSLQGEGTLVGTPSWFIRTTGCPLRCEWCDTPYTSWHAEGTWRTIEELAREVPAAARHVVVTGGEPMVWRNLPALTAALREGGRHCTVETAGIVYQELACDLMSISPKLANSDPADDRGQPIAREHGARRINHDVLRRLMTRYAYQLKFVVAAPDDVAEIDALLGQLPPVAPADVLLMPLGTSRSALEARSPWVAELCKTRGFRFSPRLHVALWGDTRGT